MTETDELLDSIRLNEYRQLGPLDKFPGKSSIIKTSALKKVISIDQHLTSKKLKTDRIVKSLIAVILTGIWALLVKDIITGKATNAYIIAGTVIGVLTAAFIYTFFINRRLNFTISLYQNGIAFNEDIFYWSQIKETAILHLPIGKEGTNYLVLLFTDNNFEIWELSNFKSFPRPFSSKLANYIEHFKMYTKANTTTA